MISVSKKYYRYRGKTPSGAAAKGEICAPDSRRARQQLQQRGIRVQSIRRLNMRIRSRDITLFTRQLAAMLKAGLPLLQAFETAAAGSPNAALRLLLSDIRQTVAQGAPLSAALARYPQYFDRFYCNLAAAGEIGGVLDTLLEKLADYREKSQRLQRKVRSALTYPATVCAVSAVVVVVMLTAVLPKFEEMYAGLGAELPWLTRCLLALSDFLTGNAFWLLPLCAALPAAVWLALKRSPPLQMRRDKALLALPPAGNIVRHAQTARWARTAATLFAAGVTLPETLDAVGKACGNLVFQAATASVRTQVAQGSTLHGALAQHEVFPPLLRQMCAIGEETGALDDMLNKAAELYEDEVNRATDTLSALAEPLIMLVLGGMVGLILVAMYLPLLDLSNAVH